jgi:hypothetical protein
MITSTGTIEVVASHWLSFNDANDIVDINSQAPFDTEAYSRMKYGNSAETRRFADELTGHVLAVRPEIVQDERPPLFVASFNVVPPVPYHLSRYALEVINSQREAVGNTPGTIVRVSKTRTQTTNYSVKSFQERIAEWASMDFFFDSEDMRPAKDVPTVVLDDLRVTGAFMNKLTGVFREHDPRALMVGYVAIFEPWQAFMRPQVEDRINGTSTTTLETILPTILEDNFDLNIRTLKLILSTEPDRLVPFLERCPQGLLDKMLRDSTDSGEDFMAFHQIGYNCLRAVTQRSVG